MQCISHSQAAIKRCRWFVLQRTGMELENVAVKDFAKQIFSQPKATLAALRAGAFFVLCDKFSESSDVFRVLTESNLAIPREQFFRLDHTCLQAGSADLGEAVRSFVTEERISDEYVLCWLDRAPRSH